MVDGVKPAGIGASAPAVRDGGKAGAEHFVIDEGVRAPAQNARLSSVAAIGMDSMLTLQAIDEAAERDRRARKRGAAMLAALTKLQRAMLAEEDPAAALRDLNELAADEAAAHDSGLAAIVRAVALRSRVEIARREFGRGGQGQG